jgi:fatty-acyl-CoA synthase
VLSYRAFFAEVNRAANLFHAQGSRPGRAVAYLLPLVPEAHIALWGAEAAGMASPMNPMLEPSGLAALLTSAGADGVVVWADEADNGGMWDRLILALALGTPVTTVYGVGQFEIARRARDLPQGIRLLDFATERGKHNPYALDSGRLIAPDEIASCFHTGGTTGIPKLALHTHFNESLNGSLQAGLAAAEHGLTFLCGLPMFHVNSPVVTGVTAFARANAVVLATRWGYRSPEVRRNFWKIVEAWRVSIPSVVPTMIASLLEQPIDANIKSLRAVFCGGAPLPAALLRRFEAAAGVKILEGYGLTEATCCCTINPPDGPRKPGSAGIRGPYLQVRTAQIKDGAWVRDCQEGEVGALLLRGPCVFPGYKSPEHDAKVWVHIDGQRWLDTGDLAYLDRDQFVWLTGRAKDLIIRSGHNIEPRVIEEAMNRHPAVSECAAVGRIDTYAGELPVAYVTLRPNTSATIEELAEHANRTIGERAAVPKFIRLVDALPLTPVGKVFKPTLRAREAALAIGDALFDAGLGRSPTVSATVDPHRGLAVSIEIDEPCDQPAVSEVMGRFAVTSQINLRQPTR